MAESLRPGRRRVDPRVDGRRRRDLRGAADRCVGRGRSRRRHRGPPHVRARRRNWAPITTPCAAWSAKDVACHADSASHAAGRDDYRYPGRRADRGDRPRAWSPGPGRVCSTPAAEPSLPGLHDHHVHVRSAASALDSFFVGPPGVSTKAQLTQLLSNATPGPDGWIRAVGYHESVAGELDRTALDAVVPHHSGAHPAPQRCAVDPQLRGAGPGRPAPNIPTGGCAAPTAAGRTRCSGAKPTWPNSAAESPRPASPASPTPPPTSAPTTWSRCRWRTVAASFGRGCVSCRRARRSCTTTVSTWTP